MRFEEGYELVASRVLSDQPDEVPELIGTKDPRRCRFCGRGRPEVSFKDEAHVVPAALGNRTLLSFDECVGCNQAGSVLEDALCKHLAPDRAVARRRSRGGNKLKWLPQDSSAQSDHERNLVTVTVEDEEPRIRIEDLGNSRAIFHLVRPKYSPMDMARALMRMGLYFIETDEPCAAAMLRWVRGQQPYQPTMLRGTFPGSGSPVTVLMVFRRKPGLVDLPNYVVLLAYANVVMMMFAPTSAACEPLAGVLAPDPAVVSYLPSGLNWERPVTILDEGKVPAQAVQFEIGYERKELVGGGDGDTTA